MKKLILIITLITSLFACSEKKKPVIIDATKKTLELKDSATKIIQLQNDTSETVATPTTEMEEPEVDVTSKDSINFDKYTVEVKQITNKAPIDFASNPNAKLFRTRIIEAYKIDEISFGGHYICAVFGCGASCIMGFMVDVRDGKIYYLPLGEENMCFWNLDMSICRPESRLFISAICKEEANSKIPYYTAYVWNEEKKIFKKIEQKEFIIKKDDSNFQRAITH